MEISAGKTQHELNLAARKTQEAALRRYQATEWLESLVGPIGVTKQPSEKEFISCLRSGLVLCNAINKIQPGSVQKVVETQLPSESPTPDPLPLPAAFQYFENVKNFLVAAEELKLTTFEAPVLERDNLEAGASAKVVDCILELKALHDWKQMNGGHGLNKPPRSPLIVKSVGKIHSQVSDETSLDTHRRPEMIASCKNETPSESESQNLEELIVATLAQCMVDKKENIDANLLASIRSRNPAALNFLCKTMSSCLKEQGQNMLPKAKPTLNDLLREESDSIAHLRTTKVMESSSILGMKKSRGACLNNGYCNHGNLLKMQENELSKLKSLLTRTKAEFGDLQSQLQTDMKLLESQVQEMSTAALGYHKVVKENKNLHDKVQVLKGGLQKTLKIVDVSPEEAELQKELESLKTALSNRELQSSEPSVVKEIRSSDKLKSATNETSPLVNKVKEMKLLHNASAVTPPPRRLSIENRSTKKVEKSSSVRRLSIENHFTQKVEKSSTVRKLSIENHSTQKAEKSSNVRRLSIENRSTQKAEKSSSVRRLSIENRSTQKVEKSSNVRRLSTGASNMVKLGKAQEPKGPNYIFGKAEAILNRSPHYSRRLSCESGKYAKTAYLEDQKILKTPVQTRKLSLEGQRYVNKDFVNSESSSLPQAAMTASKPKLFTSRGDFRPDVSRQMGAKHHLYPVSNSQVVRLEKERKVPSLESPETSVYARSPMIESLETQTASMKATANGKTSQIRKSLWAVGKLINGSENGSEKRNTQKQMKITFDATNRMLDMNLPDPLDERKLRRQSLAGDWPPATSSTPSLGVISSGNRSLLDVTPTPIHPSDKLLRSWP